LLKSFESDRRHSVGRNLPVFRKIYVLQGNRFANHANWNSDSQMGNTLFGVQIVDQNPDDSEESEEIVETFASNKTKK